MATTIRLLTDLFAQGIVLVYPGVLVFWLIMHSQIDRWRNVGKRAYWISAVGWPVTAAPLLYFYSPVFSIRRKMPLGVEILGVVSFMFAVALFRHASKQIPFRTLIGLPELEPHKNSQPVLTSGIYSKTRNPVYAAHWLLILAAAAWSGYAASWILLVADSIVLPVMVRVEERELLDRYGKEFADYMRRVPRFFV